MPREFNIKRRLAQNVSNGLMDIPHLALLRYASPSKLIAEFEETWGIKPEGVILPVTSNEGPLFRVEGLTEPLSPYATGISTQLRDFQDVVSDFAQQGMDIYLLLDPILSFIRTSSLHIVDIVGDSSASVCIYNQHNRDILSALLGTGVDIALATTSDTPGKLKGVVIDCVNLWPMGAANKRLELTCFCPSCERFFEEKYPGLLRNFKTFPNPWNLLLQDSGTGISFTGDIRITSTDEDIVGQSRQKGFDEVYEDRSTPFLREQAKVLLRYLKARHELTVIALSDIFRQSLQGISEPLKRVILTEGAHFDWTSGLHLEELDKPVGAPCDEVWFDPKSTELFLKHVPFRSYMWVRSRYYIDAFFDTASGLADPVRRATTGIGRYNRNSALNLLRSRLGQATGMAMTGQTSLASLPDLRTADNNSESYRIGFVGVTLTREIGEKFIGGIVIEDVAANSKDDPTALNELMRKLMQRQSGQEES